ncbi:MAG: regulatory protein RecX [Gemmatimonadales bacterium]
MARKAYDYALYLLTGRGYSTRNLRRKLVRKEYESVEIEAVVSRLLHAGLLDDARYAREYARQKLVSGSISVRRVQRELSVKGISSDVASVAIDEVMATEPIDIEQSIEAAARKKLAAMGDLPADVKRRRVFAFLARRGFEIGDIKRAVERLA